MTKRKQNSAFEKWFDQQFPRDTSGPFSDKPLELLLKMTDWGREAQVEMRRRNKRHLEYSVALKAWTARDHPPKLAKKEKYEYIGRLRKSRKSKKKGGKPWPKEP